MSLPQLRPFYSTGDRSAELLAHCALRSMSRGAINHERRGSLLLGESESLLSLIYLAATLRSHDDDD